MKASLAEHLLEFRRRLIVVLVFLALATVLSYPLAQTLLMKIKSDLMPGVNLVIIEPQEAVISYINVSILLGFTFTSPVIAYNLWAFIAPGMLRREKRMLAYVVLPSVALFLAGMAFGYFILLPMAFRLLLDSAAPLATPMISLGAAVSFITTILLALGLVFQMPLIAAILARIGVLKHSTLSNYRRHAIVLIILLAGIITPDPTPIPQIILSVPMIILYELSIYSAKLAGGKDAR